MSGTSRRHSKAEEAKLRRYLRRQRDKLEKKMDAAFMKELEDIYAGRHEGFSRMSEGQSARRCWRVEGSVFPSHEASLVITKKNGKPVVTILDIPVPDEATKLETKRKETELGRDERFNSLPEGGQYDEDIGPGEDIWHVHEMRVAKKKGKPEITVIDIFMDYGTKWG